MSDSARLNTHLSDLRWPWVLLAGLSPPLSSAILATFFSEGCTAFVLNALSLSKPQTSLVLERCDTASAWSAFAVNVLLTFGAAAWGARKADRRALEQSAVYRGAAADGLAAGLFSALVILGLGLLYGLGFRPTGTAQERWNGAMLAGAVLAGWLGGRNAAAALRRREALYAASRAIGTAIGARLAGSAQVHVTLWQAQWSAEGAPVQFHLLAGRASSDLLAPGAETVLDAGEYALLSHLRGGEPVSLRPAALSPAERAAWQRLGARSALLVPLFDAQKALAGLLIIASPLGRISGQAAAHVRLLGPQVAQAMENLRLVQGARQAAVFEERQRLAREIHDTLAQDLAGIVVHLEAAEEALASHPLRSAVPQRGAAPNQSTPVIARSGSDEAIPTGVISTSDSDQDPVRQHIDQAKSVAREGLAQARKLVWALRPDILQEAPLATALERAAASWAQENAVPVEVVVTGTALSLPLDTQVTLLRALQEALSNVHKHACAQAVTVTLSFMRDLVVLDVQDDGRGFHPQAAQTAPLAPEAGGFGLTAMRERVEGLGGTLLVESAPGEGTTVVVEIPVRARSETGHSEEAG